MEEDTQRKPLPASTPLFQSHARLDACNEHYGCSPSRRPRGRQAGPSTLVRSLVHLPLCVCGEINNAAVPPRSQNIIVFRRLAAAEILEHVILTHGGERSKALERDPRVRSFKSVCQLGD
ncbi:hypothetical protein CSUI_009003 [Cystoisospora suis]|uniref:Uncharacterized protein n=1 Tax=Cystoisospora suis TaxID=483139 RepID=A0A2C6KKL3_9APIC|nr:hypothetical protein CSUI_009003 [Cystoisospora suis]